MRWNTEGKQEFAYDIICLILHLNCLILLLGLEHQLSACVPLASAYLKGEEAIKCAIGRCKVVK